MAAAVRALAFAACLGAMALLPGAVTSAQQQAEAQSIRSGVLDGQTFSGTATARLLESLGQAETTAACDTERLRLEATLRLHQWQNPVGQNSAGPNPADAASRLEAALDRLLQCTPMLGFWWLVRADLAFATAGHQGAGRDHLSASWRTTPREGWVGTMRSRVAMSNLARLNADDRERVIAEVRSLLGSGITEHAEALLRQGAGPVRVLIASIISDLEPADRIHALRRLERSGIADIWNPVSPQARPADARQGQPWLRLPPALPGRPDR